MKIRILIKDKMTFWAKEGENSYSRDIKALLDYLNIPYDEELKKGEKEE